MLVECGWSAIRKKDSYLRSKYYSLFPRLGKKKALIVIAHKLLLAVYQVLSKRASYKDLGADYLSAIKGKHALRYHKKRLEGLGYKVTLQSVA